MLRELFFVEDIMKRYRIVTECTARRYMREMGGSGKPLFVTEEMIYAWEDKRMKQPEEPKRKARKAPMLVPASGELIIPRRK